MASKQENIRECELQAMKKKYDQELNIVKKQLEDQKKNCSDVFDQHRKLKLENAGRKKTLQDVKKQYEEDLRNVTNQLRAQRIEYNRLTESTLEKEAIRDSIIQSLKENYKLKLSDIVKKMKAQKNNHDELIEQLKRTALESDASQISAIGAIRKEYELKLNEVKSELKVQKTNCERLSKLMTENGTTRDSVAQKHEMKLNFVKNQLVAQKARCDELITQRQNSNLKHTEEMLSLKLKYSTCLREKTHLVARTRQLEELVANNAKPPKKASNIDAKTDFAVSNILAHKVRKGKSFFLVKWTDTWEPEENLGCPAIIKRFKKDNNLV